MENEVEEIYPQKKFFLDIIKVIFMFFLIVSLLYGIYIYDRDSYSCLENPVRYYEDMFNQSCLCKNYEGNYKINLTNAYLK